MIRQGRLEWRAEVVAQDLHNLKPGTSAVVKAANGSELTGKVRMIAPTVDLQTRSALVYVDLPTSTGGGKDAPFKAGMFASGQFELGTSQAMTVPQQAIVVRDGFSFVFRLNADQHVSQIKVTPGRRLGDRIEVLGGLTANTQVVVRGAGFLNDGDLVNKVAETAPAKVATAAAPSVAAVASPARAK
jgi:RND family efflux transporter MFP subunit